MGKPVTAPFQALWERAPNATSLSLGLSVVSAATQGHQQQNKACSPITLSFMTQRQGQTGSARAGEAAPNDAKMLSSGLLGGEADMSMGRETLRGRGWEAIPFSSMAFLPEINSGLRRRSPPKDGGTLSGSLPAEAHSGSWENEETSD